METLRRKQNEKKVMLASLLAIGLAAGVGTQIHAQDTAYLCGGYHSHMHSAADGCLRTLKEQQAARDAAAKRQAEAAQRQAQATRKQNASTTPASNTTVQPEAVSTANAKQLTAAGITDCTTGRRYCIQPLPISRKIATEFISIVKTVMELTS